MFAFQNVPETVDSSASAIDPFARPSFDLAPGLTARPFRVDNGTAKFDLTLYLSEVHEGMSVMWQFNTDLFEPATIHRLAWQFQTLLEGIGDRSAQRCLGAAASVRSRQPSDSKSIGTALKRLELFERGILSSCSRRRLNACRTPWLCLAGTDEFTYRELNERANQLARYFHELGVGEDTLAGVCLPRASETLAVLLGVWKAGGAFLPLDPDYPPGAHRLHAARRGRVAPCHANGSVAQGRLRGRSRSGTDLSGLPEIVCIDASQTRRSQMQSTANLEVAPRGRRARLRDLHLGLHGQTQGRDDHAWQCLPLRAGDGASGRSSMCGRPLSAHGSFSFSSSVRQFTVPLSCGAAVAIASTEELRDPQLLFETIRRRNISILDFVPSFSASCLQVLMSLDPSARAGLLDNHVRLMLSASEPLPSALVEGWRRLCRPGTTFVNMFGQTETTGIVMTYPIPIGGDAGDDRSDRPADRQHASLCVGRLAPPGSGRHLRRIVCRRRRHRARLYQPARADGEELRVKSVQRGRAASGFTERAIWRAIAPTALSRLSGEPMSRSRSGASASSRARSRPRSALHPGVRECVVTAADDWQEQDRIGRRKSLVAFVVARWSST